uniref:Uncharacterized protein n=1 Tax=Esox lucius TaxID=8010 RepID=A0AAY5LDS1_ESOLU
MPRQDYRRKQHPSSTFPNKSIPGGCVSRPIWRILQNFFFNQTFVLPHEIPEDRYPSQTSHPTRLMGHTKKLL